MSVLIHRKKTGQFVEYETLLSKQIILNLTDSLPLKSNNRNCPIMYLITSSQVVNYLKYYYSKYVLQYKHKCTFT